MRRLFAAAVGRQADGKRNVGTCVRQLGVLVVFGLIARAVDAQTLTTLCSFNGSNGENPAAGLTLGGSTLYGTTSSGDTVFSLPITGGNPTILAHVVNPYGSLTLSGSTLFGTSWGGGANGLGTVFSLPITGGGYTILHSFNYNDGEYPVGNLALSGSTLYGAAQTGGTLNDGTVFSVPTTGGDTTTLLSCELAYGDLQGGVTLSGSTLYLTTNGAGANGGYVLSIPVNGGTYKTLLKFTGSNGAGPLCALTLSGSTLYGTTEFGGPAFSNISFYSGFGTVFSLPISGGTATILHPFNGNDGEDPCSNLTLVGSTLYGTTYEGGAYGYGTVFGVNTDGTEFQTLFSFDNTDGEYPYGGLVASGSTLYGTTKWGGADNDGTVFSLTIPQQAPEPSTFAFLAAGALGLAGYGWRRRWKGRLAAEPTTSGQGDAPATLSFPSQQSRWSGAKRRAA